MSACGRTDSAGDATQNRPTQQQQQSAAQGAEWRPRRYEIRPESLPPPNEAESATNPPLVVERPDLVAKALVPDLLIESHSAALGLVFYDGAMFPEEYRGDAFVALRGSWNRSRRTGYKIIRVPFREGRPGGYYEDFLSGWVGDENSRTVWGRPVGLLVLKDGSLLVSEDGNNTIWRVSYKR